MTDYTADLGLYIAGEKQGAGGRETQPVLNPFTGAAQAELPLATPADLDRALEAAERGFRAWSRTPGEERGEVLRRTAQLLRERADTIARIATLEQGKPLAEAKGEVMGAAGLLDFHAGEAVRIYGRVLPRP